MSRQWGGRFETGPSAEAEIFTSSLSVDRRLWRDDIKACIIHAQMLGKQNVLTPTETEQIEVGLIQIESDWQGKLNQGQDPIDPSNEDIHTAIENALRVKIGDLAGKLHTARSRNDQVVTAFRLHLASQINLMSEEIKDLMATLVRLADENTDTIMPGLTHFQHAQPVSLAHHLLAYFWMFARDSERLQQCRRRTLCSPLGAAALAGTGFPIDREFVAQQLGFNSVHENSLDAVSDRDFVMEVLADWSILAVHLSKLAEELVLWSHPRLGYVELSDELTTGSSIMPQKKNPDVAELIRGRTGQIFGQLMAALTTFKALPLAYNRDFQEDKVMTFTALDTIRPAIRLMEKMLDSASFNRSRMSEALKGDYSNATEFADAVARSGVSFRKAHEITGQLVRWSLENKKPLEELSLEDLRKFFPQATEKTRQELSHQSAMLARNSYGGTAPSAVKLQIEKAKERLNSF